MHGCHVYNKISETAVGEMLVCMREPRNAHDKYAVEVEKDGTVIGHLPKFRGFNFVVEGTQKISNKENV